METIFHLFSIENTFVTIFDYPLSYIEFFGTILNILSVYLVVKNKIWTWPVGNVAVVLFAILFYQIQLYSDLLEQIYFLITGFYGWWAWTKFGIKKEKGTEITQTNFNQNLIAALATILGTAALGYSMSNIHLWFPTLFPEPASFAYLDAFTTVLSFIATILMAHKKVTCWYLWILVDLIGICLYFTKGVIFISLLYVIFLALATKGLVTWKKLMQKEARV